MTSEQLESSSVQQLNAWLGVIIKEKGEDNNISKARKLKLKKFLKTVPLTNTDSIRKELLEMTRVEVSTETSANQSNKFSKTNKSAVEYNQYYDAQFSVSKEDDDIMIVEFSNWTNPVEIRKGLLNKLHRTGKRRTNDKADMLYNRITSAQPQLASMLPSPQDIRSNPTMYRPMLDMLKANPVIQEYITECLPEEKSLKKNKKATKQSSPDNIQVNVEESDNVTESDNVHDSEDNEQEPID